MPALIIGIVTAAMSMFSSFMDSQAKTSQARQQARVQEANAKIERYNAEAQARALESQAQAREREKRQLRREFNEIQSRNTVSLGAGNVDISSGSAYDTALGNIQAFAEDVGGTAYAASLKRWEAAEQRRIGNERANIMDDQAKWLKANSGDAMTSLLTASFGGFGGFTSGYSSAGGNLGTLFGGKK